MKNRPRKTNTIYDFVGKLPKFDMSLEEMREKAIAAESEEKEILDAYEASKLKLTKNSKHELKKLSEYARNTLQRDKRINIRMSSKDLNQVQVIAAQEGIPYQTFISSIIHKYVTGLLTERRHA